MTRPDHEYRVSAHTANHLTLATPNAMVAKMYGAKASAEHQLASAYGRGFNGCFSTKSGPTWARHIAQYDRDAFREKSPFNLSVSAVINSHYQGGGKGKRAVHWNHAHNLDPTCFRGSQDFGNCTSWAAREGICHIIGVDIAVKGEPHAWLARAATAAIYGNRGSSGQGMSLGRAMAAIAKGVAFEVSYCDGKYDLRDENKEEAIGNGWGRRGVPDDVWEAIKNETVQSIVEMPADADAMRDALLGGAAIMHGSTLTGTTNGNLISGLKKIGGHAQTILGYDDTEEFRDWYESTTGKKLRQCVFINDQSWGPHWNKLADDVWPEHLWGPKPEGAWILTEADMVKLIKSWADAYAFSCFEGLVTDVPSWTDAFDTWL